MVFNPCIASITDALNIFLKIKLQLRVTDKTVYKMLLESKSAHNVRIFMSLTFKDLSYNFLNYRKM